MIRYRFNTWYDNLPDGPRFLLFLTLVAPIPLSIGTDDPRLMVAMCMYVLGLVWLRTMPGKRAKTGQLNVREYIIGNDRSWFSLSRYHIGGREKRTMDMRSPEVYMRRWICHTPWGSLRLHHILRSDKDRDLHDHPMSFWTLLLGEYEEIVHPSHPDAQAFLARNPHPHPGLPQPDGIVLQRKRFSLRFVPAEVPHRLILHKPVWTLVWAWPKYRRWGFHTKDEHGQKQWIDARTYLGGEDTP